ncbi:Tab2 family RNA-binding protein [Myxosarcina sp. GI1(2024)]
MKIWQVDFNHLPITQTSSSRQWELLICDRDRVYSANCDSSQANSQWLAAQFKIVAQNELPDLIQVFRPQALGLIGLAAEELGIAVEATRHTETLKIALAQRAKTIPNYHPLALEKPPPQPLPENIRGEELNFASIAAGEIINLFGERPIPILDLPEAFLPINMGVASNVPLPGIVVYGGKNSMVLASWLQRQNPVSLNYVATEVGKSGGLVLETGLVDRWIFNTFEGENTIRVAEDYQQKKRASKGLHFLLIQPDNSGMTYTGFWLLKDE